MRIRPFLPIFLWLLLLLLLLLSDNLKKIKQKPGLKDQLLQQSWRRSLTCLFFFHSIFDCCKQSLKQLLPSPTHLPDFFCRNCCKQTFNISSISFTNYWNYRIFKFLYKTDPNLYFILMQLAFEVLKIDHFWLILFFFHSTLKTNKTFKKFKTFKFYFYLKYIND